MRTLTAVLVMILFLSFLGGCASRPAHLPADKLLEWMSDEGNGLMAKKEIGEFTVSALYRSPEAMALVRSGPNADDSTWQKAREEAGNMQYFAVSYRLSKSNQDILKYNLRDESEYFSRSNYLAFGIEKDVYLLCGKDSLPCRIAHYAPHYGLSPKADLVFAFDPVSAGNHNDRVLVIEDQLFGLGILRFNFKDEDISHTPSIEF